MATAVRPLSVHYRGRAYAVVLEEDDELPGERVSIRQGGREVASARWAGRQLIGRSPLVAHGLYATVEEALEDATDPVVRAFEGIRREWEEWVREREEEAEAEHEGSEDCPSPGHG